ncbi:hypothetical protein [Streptomyces sp. NPDC026673]|uniref:hypothetical protein n=1 Tax=Streptomyces sp. NPDC026673 TaxID=3155724 RepID=UPI0033C9F949
MLASACISLRFRPARSPFTPPVMTATPPSRGFACPEVPVWAPEGSVMRRFEAVSLSMTEPMAVMWDSMQGMTSSAFHTMTVSPTIVPAAVLERGADAWPVQTGFILPVIFRRVDGTAGTQLISRLRWLSLLED